MRVVDVTEVVRSRRRIGRARTTVRIIGYPLLLFAGVSLLLGRAEALIGVVTAGVLVWCARSLAMGNRWAAAALLASTVLFLALNVGGLFWLTEATLGERLGALGLAGAPSGLVIVGCVAALRARDPLVFVDLVAAPRHSQASTFRTLLRGAETWRVRGLLVASTLVVLITFLVAIATTGLVGIIGGPVAISLFRRARAHAAVDAQRALQADRRPPVLYLRSFRDEELRIRRRWNPGRAFAENISWTDRLEEVLVRNLARIGPVIAVGEPGEAQRRLGAAREYMEEDAWRHGIREYMREATLIVVLLGRTHGLASEITMLIDEGVLQHCILVVPNEDDAEVARRWHALRVAFRQAGRDPLPDLSMPSRVLAVVPEAPGGAQEIHGEKRNEWNYEVALRQGLSQLPGR